MGRCQAAVRTAHRHRGRRRCAGFRCRQGTACAWGGTGRANRNLPGRPGTHSDPPSPVRRLRRQLRRAAGQPDCARSGACGVRRLPHRRSGHAHMAYSAARYAVHSDRYRAAGIVAAWRQARAPAFASNATPIWPDRLCDEITRALPPDGILVADTGYSGIWSSTLIELNGEGQTYLRAAGSLGWAFPAALGAKCAAPKRKVICWSGDGAIYYHLTELETARRRGIAVVLVINNNSGFGQGW